MRSQNAGRSSGERLVMMLPWVTTCSVDHLRAGVAQVGADAGERRQPAAAGAVGLPPVLVPEPSARLEIGPALIRMQIRAAVIGRGAPHQDVDWPLDAGIRDVLD